MHTHGLLQLSDGRASLVQHMHPWCCLTCFANELFSPKETSTTSLQKQLCSFYCPRQKINHELSRHQKLHLLADGVTQNSKQPLGTCLLRQKHHPGTGPRGATWEM